MSMYSLLMASLDGLLFVILIAHFFNSDSLLSSSCIFRASSLCFIEVPSSITFSISLTNFWRKQQVTMDDFFRFQISSESLLTKQSLKKGNMSMGWKVLYVMNLLNSSATGPILSSLENMPILGWVLSAWSCFHMVRKSSLQFSVF